jgi:hypothetical protein
LTGEGEGEWGRNQIIPLEGTLVYFKSFTILPGESEHVVCKETGGLKKEERKEKKWQMENERTASK